MARFDVIACAADDALGRTGRLYREVQTRFKDLPARSHSPEWTGERRCQAEMRHLSRRYSGGG